MRRAGELRYAGVRRQSFVSGALAGDDEYTGLTLAHVQCPTAGEKGQKRVTPGAQLRRGHRGAAPHREARAPVISAIAQAGAPRGHSRLLDRSENSFATAR